MITSILITMTIGYWFTYLSSRKTKLQPVFPLFKWFARHRQKSNIIGVVFLITGLILLILKYGWGQGFILWILYYATIACLIYTFAPMKIFRWFHVVGLMFIFFILDIFS